MASRIRYQSIDGKVFQEKKDRVISIGEARVSEEDHRDYKFTVELTSGLYVFVVKGRSIKAAVKNANNGVDNEHDAMYMILGHKIGRFIGRAVKYGLENASDTVKNYSKFNDSEAQP